MDTFTTKEVAERLNLTTKEVSAMCKVGDLPAYKEGNRWVINAGGWQEYLEGSKEPEDSYDDTEEETEDSSGEEEIEEAPVVRTPPDALPGEQWYFVGTRPDCPRQNIALAGVCFPRWSEKVEYDPDSMDTERMKRQGAVVLLTDVQVAEVKEASERKVFEILPYGRGILYNSTTRGFRPNKNQRPVSAFIFMQPIESPVEFRDRLPAPMAG